jgi:hypothetical protein
MLSKDSNTKIANNVRINEGTSVAVITCEKDFATTGYHIKSMSMEPNNLELEIKKS